MLLSKAFSRFVEERPVCVMARGVLERIFDAGRLDALFERTAETGYTRQLLFSSLVHMMGDVVLGVQPSMHAAFQAWETDNKVSLTALYNKLDRVEIGVSAALVQDSAAMAGDAINSLKARFAPWLAGYRCRILDGNHLSATERRLRELRTIQSAPLPGHALVVLDQERMLAELVFLTEDGHQQERALLDDVLTCIKEGDLWLADRNFCTLKFMAGIARRKAAFVFRQHAAVPCELRGRRRKIGRCSTGMVYEQNASISDPKTGERVELRRVTVKLDTPTRDGAAELHLLSNLPPEHADALKIAELYAKRWTIETVFQEITQTLDCEIQTLGYPKAALFAFCLALSVFNGVAILKASLRAVHGEDVVRKEVSGYYLALEIRGAYDGMMVALPGARWKVFRDLKTTELAKLLKQLAGNVKLARYKKHPRGPKRPQPKRSAYKNGGHVSTYKLLKTRKTPC